MLFIFIFTVFVRIKKHLNCCSFLYSVSPAHNILGPHQGKASTWEPQDQSDAAGLLCSDGLDKAGLLCSDRLDKAE